MGILSLFFAIVLCTIQHTSWAMKTQGNSATLTRWDVNTSKRINQKGWDNYCEDDEYKDFDYSKFHPSHSVIFPRRPECQIKAKGVTDEEKHFIVKHHNEKRSKVAAGEEHHSATWSPQPKAANMKELTWNDELAYIAQKWADVCIYQHDTLYQPLYEAYKKTMMCSRSY
ncbi:unnamed protein product, partial [Meganyctiphanes norvegica]